MRKLSMMMICLILLGSVNAFAGICPKTDAWIEEKVQSDEYGLKLIGMAFDGVNRIVASPFELGEYTYRGVAESDNKVTGLFEGLFTGVFEAGKSIVFGATNIVLAPIPDYHGVSKDYTFLQRS